MYHFFFGKATKKQPLKKLLFLCPVLLCSTGERVVVARFWKCYSADAGAVVPRHLRRPPWGAGELHVLAAVDAFHCRVCFIENSLLVKVPSRHLAAKFLKVGPGGPQDRRHDISPCLGQCKSHSILFFICIKRKLCGP